MATKFDFISDEQFRDGLVADYAEMCSCIAASAHKSVHVLAGSIVEAILADYLVASGYQKRSSKDPLKMQFADIIAACRAEGILSERASDLSSVVRSYRNLIHPGRVVRLNERVDANSASIAKALVDMIIEEVVAGRKEKYGFTAEQIVSKIERDPSSISILMHLLKDTKEVEREKLLTTILPKRYFETLDDVAFGPRYEACFRETFASLSDERKARVARRMVAIIKEEDEQHVLNYETAFFKAADMKYLQQSEIPIVKEHLLSRIERQPSQDLIGTLEGIGPYLSSREALSLVDTLIRCIGYGKDILLRTAAQFRIGKLYWEIRDQDQKKIDERLDSWIRRFEEKSPEKASVIKEIKDYIEIPF
jgi:hypothetical protein